MIGALCVGSSRPGFFSFEERRFLTKLAGSAAVALENARLFEQAERVAALEERHRIAAEMHDELDKVGEGTHERFIVDADKQQARIQEKVARWKGNAPR